MFASNDSYLFTRSFTPSRFSRCLLGACHGQWFSFPVSMFTDTALFEAIKFLCDGRMNTMTLITTLEYRFPRLIVCKLTNGIDSMKVPRILSEISKCRATRKRTHRCGVLRHFSNHYGNPFKKRLETTSWR